MRLPARIAALAASAIALATAPTPVLAQDGCLADLNDDGVVNGTDLAIVLGGWGPCPVNTTFVGGVVKVGGAPVAGATVTTDLGGETVSGDGGIFLLQLELPSVIETVTLTASAEINGVGFEGTKTVSPVSVGVNNLVGLIEVTSGGCDAGLDWRSGPGNADFDGPVRCIIECDLGDGPRLFVGGDFTTVNGMPIAALAVWDGMAWSSVDAQFSGSSSFGFPTSVRAMAVYDNGSGPALYVGGSFTQIGSTAATALARWDGNAWSTPNGYPHLENALVNTFVIHDFGPSSIGRSLVAGGSFPLGEGQQTYRICAIATKASVFSVVNGQVNAMTSLNGDLYLGGRFHIPGTSNSWAGLAIASWGGLDGLQVVPYPPLEPTDSVSAMTTIGTGKGTDICLAGQFSMVDSDGAVANNIVRWSIDPVDGWRWHSLGMGTDARVSCLLSSSHDGEYQLFAGGEFTQAGNSIAFRIAEWDGQLWSPLESGLDGPARVLFLTADSLLVGGEFSAAGDTAAAGFAEWGCPAP